MMNIELKSVSNDCIDYTSGKRLES
jgi:hypothetical protein